MSALPILRSCLDDDLLLPADAAFAARTTLENTRGLGYTPFNLDGLTCHLLGLLGSRATVRHVSGSTDEILGFLSDTGLVISERLLKYETADEAFGMARRLVAEGHRLVWSYPLPEETCAKAGHLVPSHLWHFLNDKRNLPRLSPAENLPSRQVLAMAAAQRQGFAGPCFLKAADNFATGWGYMVRHCPTPADFEQAIAWFGQQDYVTELILEEAIDLKSSWCMNISVNRDGVSFAAGVEQIFSAPGKQSGSVIDPLNPPPAAGFALVKHIGEAARRLGFLGPAGIDIGLAKDGRVYAFDPNFRFTSSYAQGLLHDAAARRAGLGTSLSVAGFTPLDCRALLAALRGPVMDGWLVPTRIIDGALLPAAEGRSHFTGFVLANSREDAEKRAAVLKALTSAPG